MGRECAANDVRAIQLVGWNDGGNPSHLPDPRLGTADELRQAIEEIHELGVHVVLFCKFIYADRTTQAFRQELVVVPVRACR